MDCLMPLQVIDLTVPISLMSKVGSPILPAATRDRDRADALVRRLLLMNHRAAKQAQKLLQWVMVGESLVMADIILYGHRIS